MTAAKAARSRFRWRNTGEGVALHLGTRPLVMVVADGRYPGMYRVRTPDGALSDMVNLTRAKDAALALARRVPETTVVASPIRLNGVRASLMALGQENRSSELTNRRTRA